MRTNDIEGELGDDFEPEPLAIGPDGVHLNDNARVIPPPPRLCEAGPCRNYHRFTTQLDAETPMAGSVEQGDQHGKLVGHGGPQPFHVHVHHYCYPTVGIETELGSMPVLDCNRWDPNPEGDSELEVRRARFLESPAGKRYTEDLDAWRDARAQEADANLPAVGSMMVVIDGVDYPISVAGHETLRAVRQVALDGAYTIVDGVCGHCSANGKSAPAGATCGHTMPAPVEDWTFVDSDGNPITNLDATLHQLGISHGERLTLLIKGA